MRIQEEKSETLALADLQKKVFLNEKRQLLNHITREIRKLLDENKQYFVQGDVSRYQHNCMRITKMNKRIKFIKKEIGIAEKHYLEPIELE